MTVTIYELYDQSRPYSIDQSGTATASRTFRVSTVDQEAAEDALQAEGITLASAYPNRFGLYLDRFQYSAPIGGSALDVTALYSSDRQFSPIVPPDKLDPEWYRLNSTTRIVDLEYPILNFVPITIQGKPSGKRQWVVSKGVRPETEQEFSVSVVVNAWSMDRENAVSSQVGKVHTIAGRESLFMGHSLNGQINASSQQYEVQYTWRIDFGTPDFGIPDDPNIELPIGRPPFYAYTTRVVDDPTVDRPSAITYPLYPFNPDGWQSLPGMVPL